MSNIPNLSAQSKVITPSSPEYDNAIARSTLTAVIPAKYVVYPSIPSNVSAILKFARTQNPPLAIAVKGGGINSYPVSSSEGITIDMSQIKHVKLSEDKKSVAVGGGAIWQDVYASLEEHGLIVPGANVWSVGVAAYVLGGGYSNLTAAHGFGCDNLLEATVILADGRIMKCDADHEPDLFWALRGAGIQFGVVTELVLKTYLSHGPALTGALIYAPTASVIWDFALEDLAQSRNLQSDLEIPGDSWIGPSPPEQNPRLLMRTSKTFKCFKKGTPEEIDAVLAPFRNEITPLFEQTVTLTSFLHVSHATDGITKQFPPRRINGGALFGSLWDDLVHSIFDEWLKFTENNDSKNSLVLWELFPPGEYSEIDVKDTAYPARKHQNYFLVYGLHTSPEIDAPTREWIAKMASKVNNTNVEKMGFKFPTPPNSGTGLEAPEDIYGENLQRLRELKSKYDPNQVFNKKYWVIPPLT